MNYDQFYQGKNDMYFGHDRKELLAYVPSNINNALDVGCGGGAFGALLKQQINCEVWGIEPNKIAADLAATKLDKAINGLFTKNMPQLAEKKFDAIFFNDVLEHLNDPGETLADCHNLLNKDGYIIASIPNIRWYPVILSLLRYKDFKYADAGVMDKTHLRFFTKTSMVRLFTDAGYKVLKIEGINKSKNFIFFNIINALLFNTQEDMKYPQFVVVAQK